MSENEKLRRLNPHELLLKGGEVYIKQKPTKHEKIEQKAWEIYKDALYAKNAFGDHFLKGGMIQQIRRWSFKHAEEFYNYAQEKEKEENV